jgi:hypothetical protein
MAKWPARDTMWTADGYRYDVIPTLNRTVFTSGRDFLNPENGIEKSGVACHYLAMPSVFQGKFSTAPRHNSLRPAGEPPIIGAKRAAASKAVVAKVVVVCLAEMVSLDRQW